MTNTLRVGCIGVGSRGRGLMTKMIKMPHVNVIGIFDPKQSSVDAAVKASADLNHKLKVYAKLEDMLSDSKIDAVVIATSWAGHVPLACAAMEAGKKVGLEVGPAMSIEDCFKLVEVQERTGTPLMFLENACFGRDELLAINLIKNNLLGEMVHGDGTYQHDCTELVYNEYKAMSSGEPGNERILNRLNRAMEPYPTHDLGPIAKAFNINRGNRMVSLVAMMSKARGLKAYIERVDGQGTAGEFSQLAQGDVVTTVIKCAKGETITLTWNTSLPVVPSRGLRYFGSRGSYVVELKSVYVADKSPEKNKYESQEKYEKKYKHPGWKWFDRNKLIEKYNISSKGHGDMDYLTLFAFVECARNDQDFPIDVYDAASWMAISVLVEQSLALGSQPVFIPDFTNGKWLKREPQNTDERWMCGL